MNKLKKIMYLALTLALTLSLAGCGAGEKTSEGDKSADQAVTASTNEKKDLKLGCLAYSEPIVQWIKAGLEPLGYKVEVLMFDANQLPATALKDGDLDGIIANHKPWIETFNKQNNSDLAMPEPYGFYGCFGIFSVKYKDLKDLPQNAQIAVPGDPSNMSRSLEILQGAGVITLSDKTGPFYTVMEIKDNPKKIKLIETEITQTARSLQDVDAIVSSAFYVGETGLLSPNDALYEDPKNTDFPLGLIVKKEDVQQKWTQDALAFIKSEDFKTKFNDHFNGRYRLFE